MIKRLILAAILIAGVAGTAYAYHCVTTCYYAGGQRICNTNCY